MQSKIIREKNEWEKILLNFKKKNQCDFYHEFEYVNLYSNKNSEVNAFLFTEGEKSFFFPYLKRNIKDNPNLFDFETAYGYGGPISTSEDPEFIKKAWNNFINQAKNEGIIAGLVRFHPLLHTKSIFINNSNIKLVSQCETVWLDCKQGLEKIVNNYSADIKKRILKAKKDGIVCECSHKKNDLMIFAEIYKKRMKLLEARSDYFFNEEYFELISNFKTSNYKVYLVKKPDNEVIGGALVFFNDFFCNVHLSSSLKEFFNLSPNIILRDVIIKDCLKLKIKKIHFGGGRTSRDDDSLLNFKKKFSKKTTKYFVGGLVINTEIYEKLIENWKLKNKEKIKLYENFFLKYKF